MNDSGSSVETDMWFHKKSAGILNLVKCAISAGPGEVSYPTIFLQFFFFCVTRTQMEHISEEIVWLPFFSQMIHK